MIPNVPSQESPVIIDLTDGHKDVMGDKIKDCDGTINRPGSSNGMFFVNRQIHDFIRVYVIHNV